GNRIGVSVAWIPVVAVAGIIPVAIRIVSTWIEPIVVVVTLLVMTTIMIPVTIISAIETTIIVSVMIIPAAEALVHACELVH
ncbi:MAG: hypothetical protein CG440_1115, partial [Methanosaeta sp. NSM2]